MLRFSKMQGAGNDFVVIDGIHQTFHPTPSLIRALCDLHFGIGADQLLLVEAALSAEVDFLYRIFNCDGREVEMCGNGARCFGRFVRERGFTSKDEIRAQTMTRVVTMHYCDDQEVAVDMGIPELLLGPKQFSASGVRTTEMAGRACYQIPTSEGTFTADLLSFGNPHAVVLVDERPSVAALERCGRAIETSALFPEKINVEFMTVLNPGSAYVDVWERGSGATLACGSGACASAVSGQLRGLLNETVRLMLPGGQLTVSWDGDPMHSVTLKGPAKFVFDGEVDEVALLQQH